MRRPAALTALVLTAALLAALPPASYATEGAGSAVIEWPPDLLLAGVLIGIGTLASLAVAAAATLAARRAPASDPRASGDVDRHARQARAREHLDDDPIMTAMGLGEAEERRSRRAPPRAD